MTTARAKRSSRAASAAIASTARLSRQSGEVAMLAPWVVGQRLMRMAQAGTNPSLRDRREFTGMVLEKPAAFAQGWMAMGMACLRMQQQWWAAWMQSAAIPGRWPTAPMPSLAQWQRMASQGMAPIHRQVSKNAKRLGR